MPFGQPTDTDLEAWYADGDQREFGHKTKVITNESKINSEIFHNCALNK